MIFVSLDVLLARRSFGLAIAEYAYELVDDLSRKFEITHYGEATSEVFVVATAIEINPLDLAKVHRSGRRNFEIVFDRDNPA